MDIVRPDAVAPASKPGAGAPAAAAGDKPFAQVLEEMDFSRLKVHSPEVLVPSLQTRPVDLSESLRENALKIAAEPNGLERLAGDLGRGSLRLQELVSELKSGREFSPAELLAVQAEVHEVTIAIEVTTKVVAEAVSGVRQLLSQQA